MNTSHRSVPRRALGPSRDTDHPDATGSVWCMRDESETPLVVRGVAIALLTGLGSAATLVSQLLT